MKRVVTFCLASGCTASREPGLIYCYYLETSINFVNLNFTFVWYVLCKVCMYPLFSVLESIKFFLLHQILSGVSHSSWDFINSIDEFSPQFFFSSFMYNKHLLITQLLNASNLKFTPVTQSLNE